MSRTYVGHSSRAYVHGAEPIAVRPTDHLPGRLRALAERWPQQPVLALPDDSGWRELTRAELAERVRSVAVGLVARGMHAGDRVALMSPTRAEWPIVDLAVQSAGGVTVPLYETSSAEQCRRILEDAGVAWAVVASAELADRLEAAGAEEIFVLDDGGLDELADDGNCDRRTDRQLEQRLADVTLDDVATIVYTSGSTGRPKGCVLTHGNLAWTTRQTELHLDEVIGSDGRLLMMLPLAHIFARLIQFVCLDAGLQVGYPSSLERVRTDLRTFGPTVLLGTPRVFEKFFEAAQEQATGARRVLFRSAVATGRSWAETDRPGPWLRARRAIADLLVYRRIRTALGGRVRYCVSGGAPLSRDLGLQFAAAGLPILEGYGLTETTAPVTVNTPSAWRLGTVGHPLPGVEIHLADDGEVLVRGGNVFRGYHGDNERSGFEGDWFRTGDLGTVDDDGFLTLHDRKKDLIVTASGKNVSPTLLEQRLTSNDLVAQAMVVGDRRRFIAALVTVDDEMLRAFAERHGIDGDPQRLRRHRLVRDEVQRAVDYANEAVSRAESIREFVILDRQFTEDATELTPTQKLRRNDIAEHFSDEIESIYRS